MERKRLNPSYNQPWPWLIFLVAASLIGIGSGGELGGEVQEEIEEGMQAIWTGFARRTSGSRDAEGESFKWTEILV